MVKAKRNGDGSYLLTYKGKSVVITLRPDKYFDLVWEGTTHKGLIKQHKERLVELVDAWTGTAPPAQEGVAPPPPTAGPPPAPDAAPAAEQPAIEPVRKGRTQILREAPPDAEPNVTMTAPGLQGDNILRSHGARRTGELITLTFETYTGAAVKVTMGLDAAIRHLERVEAMVLAAQSDK